MDAPKKVSVTVGDFKAGPKEKQYVNDVLNSGRLSYGPYSRRFEQEWARLHDSKFSVFCNSGTSALHIAVAALKAKYKWKDGDEVIVPSVTFVATSNVLLHNNLKPVFVDVNPLTYNLDANKIEPKLSARTRAVIPVHLCGLPADMLEVTDLTNRYGLSVIEDSCETTFAQCHGKKVGAWGDIGCFSTYMAHYVVTGVGGLATTSDPDLAVALRSLMNHGRNSIYLSIDDDDGLTGEKLHEVMSRRFQFTSLGHSFRCTEMEAALGVAQLERYEEIVARRKAVAARYTAGLKDLEEFIQLPSASPGCEHVYMLYPLVTKTGPKLKLTEYLEDRGVETRDLLPLLGQPVYKQIFGPLLPEYPVAENLDSCGFYIGCHQHISDSDVDHVVEVIHDFFKGARS